MLDTAALARRAADPRRGAQPQARHARRSYFRTAHPARPTARSTTPGPRSTCCTALIGRLGSHKVHTLGDAIEFAKAVTPTQRRKRHLAEGLPRRARASTSSAAADDRPLYVGTSQRHRHPGAQLLHRRARSARGSPRCSHAAERVEAVECAHSLEAEVRELRLIAAHKPPYNRRSKYPGAGGLAQADRRGVPAAVGGRAGCADDGAAYLGPFASRRAAELAAAGGLRRAAAAPVHATGSPPARATPGLRAGRAGPLPGALRAPDHPRGVRRQRGRRRSAPRPPATRSRWCERAAGPHRRALADDQRYEEAAVVRSRLAALLRATVRMQRLAALTRAGRGGRGPAATPVGGWEIAVVRHGRLAAAGTSPPRRASAPDAGRAARPPPRRSGPGRVRCRARRAEETERILAWLERPDTRLVEMSGGWASPVAWRGPLHRPARPGRGGASRPRLGRSLIGN